MSYKFSKQSVAEAKPTKRDENKDYAMCESCGFMLHLRSILRHSQICQKNQGETRHSQCNICSKYFISRQALHKHGCELHQEITDESNGNGSHSTLHQSEADDGKSLVKKKG